MYPFVLSIVTGTVALPCRKRAVRPNVPSLPGPAIALPPAPPTPLRPQIVPLLMILIVEPAINPPVTNRTIAPLPLV